MKNHCEAHNLKPDPTHVKGYCYGELWVCINCKRTVCAGFGCADDTPDICDDCWAEAQVGLGG